MRELNLLPPNRRTLVRLSRITGMARGLVMTGFWGMLAVTIVGGGVMGWLFIVSRGDNNQQLAERVEEYRELVQLTEKQNAQLRALAAYDSERVVWSPLVGELLTVVPTSVTIDKISFNAPERRIEFGGVAGSRADLIVFERELKELSWAAAVEAPRENLLERQRPSYEFTITLGEDL